MTQPLPAPVRHAIDAANLGDTDQFVGLFRTYLGCVNHWGRAYYGANAIREWSDRALIGRHTVVKVVHHYRPTMNEVVVIAHVSGDGFGGPATLSFELNGDSIQTMHVTA